MQIRKHPPRSPLFIATLAALALGGVTPALAQTRDDETASEERAKRLEAVQVVGSRIKRATIEGPSPVTIITNDQLQREGFVTVAETLETITQNAGSVQNELNSAGGFTPNGTPVNLRGLGTGRTLLLINGRRAADYPFPYNGQSNFQNFNNIPTAAVERIEILSGGASAIYGSDAVAGVINVVLRKDFRGDVAKLRTGTSTEGGGDFADLQWVGGRTGDGWSLTYALQYYADEPVYGFQRDFMDSRLDNPLPPAVVGIQPAAGLRINRIGLPTGSLSFIAPRPAPAPASAANTSIGPTARSMPRRGRPSPKATPAGISMTSATSRSPTATTTCPATSSATSSSTTAWRPGPA